MVLSVIWIWWIQMTLLPFLFWKMPLLQPYMVLGAQMVLFWLLPRKGRKENRLSMSAQNSALLLPPNDRKWLTRHNGQNFTMKPVVPTTTLRKWFRNIATTAIQIFIRMWIGLMPCLMTWQRTSVWTWVWLVVVTTLSIMCPVRSTMKVLSIKTLVISMVTTQPSVITSSISVPMSIWMWLRVPRWMST